jgi:RimJ/RimL family protein N-acetyltransferase
MVRWGFTEWPWVRIVWRCDTENIASARVAEKAGMIKEGCMRSDTVVAPGKRRDTFLYAILKDEWLSSVQSREADGK